MRAFLNRLWSWFLHGIALIAPLAITIAFLFWLGSSLELFVGGLVRGLLPKGWYLPGMGLVVGLVVTLVAGLMANLFLVQWLVRLAEHVLDRIPLVKSVFQGLKDVARFFSDEREKSLGRPVAVEVQGLRLVGFVTQESARLPGDLPDGETDRVAVYLPMSYQLGGYTVYLARDRVTPLEVGTEQAMRAVLTGGSLMHSAAAPASRSGLRDRPTAPARNSREAGDSASTR